MTTMDVTGAADHPEPNGYWIERGADVTPVVHTGEPDTPPRYTPLAGIPYLPTPRPHPKATPTPTPAARRRGPLTRLVALLIGHRP